MAKKEIEMYEGKPVLAAANSEKLVEAIAKFKDKNPDVVLEAPYVVRVKGKKIKESAFFRNETVGVIILNDTVTEILEYAFCNCTNLKKVVIPESVTKIYSRTFKGCTSLESIEIPNSVVYLGNTAFNGCSALSSVTLSENLKAVDTGTFEGCSNLQSVSIPKLVEEVDTDAFKDCTSLIHVDIPESVNKIGADAFYNCLKLRTINIATPQILDGTGLLGECTFKDGIVTIDISKFIVNEVTVHLNLHNVATLETLQVTPEVQAYIDENGLDSSVLDEARCNLGLETGYYQSFNVCDDDTVTVTGKSEDGEYHEYTFSIRETKNIRGSLGTYVPNQYADMAKSLSAEELEVYNKCLSERSDNFAFEMFRKKSGLSSSTANDKFVIWEAIGESYEVSYTFSFDGYFNVADLCLIEQIFWHDDDCIVKFDTRKFVSDYIVYKNQLIQVDGRECTSFDCEESTIAIVNSKFTKIE